MFPVFERIFWYVIGVISAIYGIIQICYAIVYYDTVTCNNFMKPNIWLLANGVKQCAFACFTVFYAKYGTDATIFEPKNKKQKNLLNILFFINVSWHILGAVILFQCIDFKPTNLYNFYLTTIILYWIAIIISTCPYKSSPEPLFDIIENQPEPPPQTPNITQQINNVTELHEPNNVV